MSESTNTVYNGSNRSPCIDKIKIEIHKLNYKQYVCCVLISLNDGNEICGCLCEIEFNGIWIASVQKHFILYTEISDVNYYSAVFHDVKLDKIVVDFCCIHRCKIKIIDDDIKTIVGKMRKSMDCDSIYIVTNDDDDEIEISRHQIIECSKA